MRPMVPKRTTIYTKIDKLATSQPLGAKPKILPPPKKFAPYFLFWVEVITVKILKLQFKSFIIFASKISL